MHQIHFQGRALTPSKIICVGRNYVAHIHELGNPIPEQMVVFCKPNSAIGAQLKAYRDEPIHYETEMCFLIQAQQLAGIGIGLDLTKRTLQAQLKSKGLPWERAKAFDGAAVFSPFVALPDSLDGLRLCLHIDGRLAQQGELQHMIYSPQTILAAVSSWMHLETGDVLMTGTPSGVGPLQAGSHYTAALYNADHLLIEHSWTAI